MNIIVTGSNGYIGSHVCEVLLREGHSVLGIDNMSTSSYQNSDQLKKVYGNKYRILIMDMTKLDARSLPLKTKYDALIHMAAYKSVPESIVDPLMYYKNNINSLFGAIEIVQVWEIPTLIFSSSSSVYKSSEFPSVEFGALDWPTDCPYGNTKAICERILEDLSQASTTFFIPDIVSLRYFNPIGNHFELNLGDTGNRRDGIQDAIINSIKKGTTFQVFGGDWPTPDGTPIRDYIYIGDLAKIHVEAIKWVDSHKLTNQYVPVNVGTGTGISVLELLSRLPNIKYEIGNKRPGDIGISISNTYRFSNLSPNFKFTSVDDIVSSIINYETRTRNES
jgi:UDP-glucose 4-epimerase